jgi:hypothetical protein
VAGRRGGPGDDKCPVLQLRGIVRATAEPLEVGCASAALVAAPQRFRTLERSRAHAHTEPLLWSRQEKRSRIRNA